MKFLGALGLLLVMTGAAAAADARVAERAYTPIPGIEQYSYSFAVLPLLPRRFQNHCGYYQGHFVCADRCGIDFQMYYCTNISYGCCHVGYGYCDDIGHLRCMPALF
jgi:hypothetical protein